MYKSFRDRLNGFDQSSCSQPPTLGYRRRSGVWGFLASGLAATVVALSPTPGQAQAPAPAELTTFLSGVDAAANTHNAANVLAFYAPTFQNSDGLTRSQLETSLGNLWKRYTNLAYRTELKTWKQEGKALVADTVTYITGTKQEGDREFKLAAELEARQYIEAGKLVRQEILNERSQITSGEKPPTVKINLPEMVKRGQEFNFDAVVQEPLGDDLLLGAAIEEPIKPEGFLDDTTAKLEPLNSGGIFKVGKVPGQGKQHWLSAVIVRHNGITMITQRLNVK